MKSIFKQFSNKWACSILSQSSTRLDELRKQFPDVREWQRKIIQDVEDWTMTSPERILALSEATKYIVEQNIEGGLVECGVWRGGSMAAVANTLRQLGVCDRQLWMYDTFEGMTAPTTADVDINGRQASEIMRVEATTSIDPRDPESIWCQSPLDGVKQRMASTGYPSGQMRFIKGRVEDTLPHESPERIALLRLDTDWYESTKCELEYLFPKLEPGGVFIVDDYGHWQGCRRAVDEYFAEHEIKMMLNRIDYTGRIGIYMPTESTHHVRRNGEAAA